MGVRLLSARMQTPRSNLRPVSHALRSARFSAEPSHPLVQMVRDNYSRGCGKVKTGPAFRRSGGIHTACGVGWMRGTGA